MQTNPYVIIEGAYLVAADSPIRSNDEVDRDGVRIAVGRGSAYDLYLRVPSSTRRSSTRRRRPRSPICSSRKSSTSLQASSSSCRPTPSVCRACACSTAASW
jgi:hypothetical protein